MFFGVAEAIKGALREKEREIKQAEGVRVKLWISENGEDEVGYWHPATPDENIISELEAYLLSDEIGACDEEAERRFRPYRDAYPPGGFVNRSVVSIQELLRSGISQSEFAEIVESNSDGEGKKSLRLMS